MNRYRHALIRRTDGAQVVDELEPRTLLAIVPIAPEFRLSEMQGDFPTVALDADGDAVVVWQGYDRTSWGIYAQLHGSDGRPKGEPFLVHEPSQLDQERPSVAMDADGNFAVAWYEEDGEYRDGHRTFVRKFDASGTPIMPATPVSSTDLGDEEASSIAMDADGDFIVVWHRTGAPDSPTEGIWARRFGADGTPLGLEFRTAPSADGYEIGADVAMDAIGNFVVIWQQGPAGVRARRFDATGSPLDDGVPVTTTLQGWDGSVAMNAGGQFVVAWVREPEGSVFDVVARVFESDGTPATDEFFANSEWTGGIPEPDVAIAPSGAFGIVWASDDAYARFYDAQSTPEGPESPAHVERYDHQHVPAIAMSSERAVVVFTNDGDANYSYFQPYVRWYEAGNGAPVTGGVADFSVPLDAPDAVVNLFDAFDDPDHPDTALTLTVTGNTDPALFRALTVEGATGQLVLDFDADAFGESAITVRATDPAGAFVEAVFTVTVRNELVLDGTRHGTIDAGRRLDLIHLSGSARLVVRDGGTEPLVTRALVIDGGSALDLGDNDLVIQANATTRHAVFEMVQNRVLIARNTVPRWSEGLTSSAAAADPLTGLAVGLAGNDVIVKYTYNGDANLDGRINADDYFRIDQGFLAQPQNSTYVQGDFNYDGRINADDYFLIDQAFLGQGAPLIAGSANASALPAAAMSSVAPLTVRVTEEPLGRKRTVRPRMIAWDGEDRAARRR